MNDTREEGSSVDTEHPASQRANLAPLALVVVALGLVCVAACSTNSDDGWTELEDVMVNEEAIGEANCATALADATFQGTGEYSRDAPYSNPDCARAVVVDILNYRATLDDSRPVWTTARWTGSVPLEQQHCNAAFLRADVYQRVNGEFALIATDAVHGNWSSECHFDTIHETLRMVSGNDYRLAVSATRARAYLQANVRVASLPVQPGSSTPFPPGPPATGTSP